MKLVIYELFHYKIKKCEVPEDELPLGEEYETSEKRIGIFSSHAMAEAAIREIRSKPGFREWPDGFRIGISTLDPVGKERGWDEGFFSI